MFRGLTQDMEPKDKRSVIEITFTSRAEFVLFLNKCKICLEYLEKHDIKLVRLVGEVAAGERQTVGGTKQLGYINGNIDNILFDTNIVTGYSANSILQIDEVVTGVENEDHKVGVQNIHTETRYDTLFGDYIL